MVRAVLSAIAAKQKTWLACGFGRLDGFVGLVVFRRPCLFMQMRPLAVAVEGSKCFRTFSTVRCGNVVSCLFSMAASRVGIGGQNKVWCIYFIACCLVGIVYAFMAMC